MENFFIVLAIVAFLLWIAGLIKIIASDNNNLTKIILLFLSCSFPPFMIFYIWYWFFKSQIHKEIKNAPEKIINDTIVAGKFTTKAATKTVDFLLKK